MTPRSLETPVQLGGNSKCPSLNLIRDPYASRFPTLRQSASVENSIQRHLARGQQHPGCGRAANHALEESNDSLATTPGNSDSIYTILIRLPPAGKTILNSSSRTANSNGGSAAGERGSGRDPLMQSAGMHPPVMKTPSIQMLSEHDCELDLERAGIPSTRSYPRSLPITRRFESAPGCGSAGGAPHGGTRSHGGSVMSRSTTSASFQQRRGGGSGGGGPHRPPGRQTDSAASKLPLDARLVPKQLLRSEQSAAAVSHSSLPPPSSASLGNMTMVSATVAAAVRGKAGVKQKKSSSEKKQDRKAAKTLSAILLAFIVTWTPYSVLVVINGLLGKQSADKHIPDILWQFSYYLCYINSTVNPVLYALCNAAFRRTYVRILSCKWGSRARQPINRYYYG